MALAFDATYYFSQRPDVFQAYVATGGSTGLDAAEFAQQHYNTYGRFEGANPNATFNTNEYLAANLDVAAAGVNPFQHYLQFGVNEGRAPSDSFPSFASFEADYAAAYLAANPDLAAAGIDTPNEAYAHFVIFGQFEGRAGAPVVDNGLPGSTFTLTAGADTVSGTKGNDIIIAQPVDATGAAKTTLSAFDAIDGGAGVDTLNIYTTGAENNVFPTAAAVKNVEIVNVYNTGIAAALGDASKFEGVTQLWQHAAAVDVTNLAATTTAGFKSIEATVAADLDVSAAAAATSVKIALDGVKGAAATGAGETENRADIDVDGAALNAVTVSGTLAQKTTTTAAAAASLALNVSAGKDVESLTVDTAVTTTLTVTENAGSAATKDLRTLDASASKGGITFGGSVTGGTAGSLATIKTGAGADTVTIATATLKDNATTTTIDETVSALLETGSGNDTITVSTTGTGTTTVNAGEGNDKVDLTTDAGTGVLTVNLGTGNDTFSISGAGAVSATDVIDGGEGTDTLLLTAVGSANIGAFSNFEVFDAKGLNKTLDVEILASKNTVSEFIASGDTGGATVLTNIGAGVGFRVTGDTTIGNVTTLTQKAAGALTITLDIDQKIAADTVAADFDAAVAATNATAIKAVFDSSFVDKASAVAGDNTTNLAITGTKATSLDVVSGGDNAINTLNYSSGVSAVAGKDLLDTITISGDRALTVTVAESAASTSQVTAINASALTGALTISTAELKAGTGTAFDGGVLTLGAGSDVITGTTGSVISGFAKGAAEDATVQGAFDILKIAGAVQATDVAATATITVKDGLLTFNGTGPATLDAAIALAATATDATNEAVVFEYVGNSYIYATGIVPGLGGDDVVVKLAGVTGLTGLDDVNAAGTNLYVF